MRQLALFLMLAMSSVARAGLFENQFLPLDQAERAWGRQPFLAENFRNGTKEDRGAMSVDLIRTEKFHSAKLTDIRKTLGASDAKYENGRLPAYRLPKIGQESLILVFLPDFSGKLVEDVKIYREPLDSTHEKESGVSAGPARLPISLEGSVAESIFKHLTAVPEGDGAKNGKNVSCTHSGETYRCKLELDSNGVAYP